MANIDFWFDFASTYSYLSAMRIGDAAAARGVTVCWRPFLLGPIFASQGWNTSPFAVYPAKGRYMWRDVERRAAALGIAWHPPATDDPRVFPQNSVLAARIALIGLEAGWGEEFCRAVFRSVFAEARDIADPAFLADLVAPFDPEAAARAADPANRAQLRGQVEEAARLGIFGAPTFVTGGELFWGDDRLEAALDWAIADA